MPLVEGEDSAAIAFDQPVSRFTVTISGERNLFKCFAPDSCVAAGTTQRTIPFASRSNLNGPEQLLTYEPIVLSDEQDLIIERRLDNQAEGHFRIIITYESAIRQLGLESLLSTHPQADRVILFGEGQRAASRRTFVGLAAPLAWHGHPEAPGSQSPAWVAHVFPEGEAIKVRVERLPYSYCTYEGQHGDRSFFTVTMPPSEDCPSVPFYSNPGKQPGQNDTDVREWVVKQ